MSRDKPIQEEGLRKVNEFNWEGLAELGWRATQQIGQENHSRNCYWEWGKLTEVEKHLIQQRWVRLPSDMKYRFTKMAEAMAHAYIAASTL